MKFGLIRSSIFIIFNWYITYLNGAKVRIKKKLKLIISKQHGLISARYP